MKNHLEVKNMSKRIKGEYVMKDVTLDFESGYVYVLQGENGSGKTMLLRYVSGLINCDEGELRYNNEKCIFGEKRPFSVGMVLENVGLYSELSLYDNLKIIAGINRVASKQDIIDTIARVGLDPYSKKRYGKFSLGMKKRAAIAQAILEKPDVLLLDEPTNALDEAGRELFFEILKEEKERGAIVIVSSHISEDIKGMADEVIAVNEGKYTKVSKDKV